MLTHTPDLAADVAHLAQERIDLVQAGHLPLPVLLQQCMGSAGAALLRPLVDGHECRRPVGNAHVRAADLRHQGATLGLVQEALQAAHARQAIRARAAARIAGHLEHGEQLRLDLAEARHVQHQGDGAFPAVAGAGHHQVRACSTPGGHRRPAAGGCFRPGPVASPGGPPWWPPRPGRRSAVRRGFPSAGPKRGTR